MTDQKKQQLIAHMQKLGFPENAIPAIMANIEVETGGSFDYRQKQKGGRGYGLLQFDFMKPYYKSYLKEKKAKDNDYNQLSFMYDTIYGPKQNVIGAKTAEKLRMSFDTKDPIGITHDLVTDWFNPGKPNLNKRLAAVNNYWTPPETTEVVPARGILSQAADMVTAPMTAATDYLADVFWNPRKMFGRTTD